LRRGKRDDLQLTIDD